jgi:hypothetical protein
LPRSPPDLYAEAIRPYFDDMDFVVMYRLPGFDEGSIVGTYNIYPDDMRMYLDGAVLQGGHDRRIASRLVPMRIAASPSPRWSSRHSRCIFGAPTPPRNSSRTPGC